MTELARRELLSLRPCVHGGEIDEELRSLLQAGKFIDFSSNVNPLKPPRRVVEAILRNVERINSYPEKDGVGLRRLISSRLGIPSYENIILGNGSTELIHFFTEAFIERGDRVLIPIPTFGEYEVAVRKMGGKVVYIEPGDGLKIDVEGVLAALRREGAKCLFLCNPNNPTGFTLSAGDVERILETCVERNCILFLDEAFIDFVGEELSFVGRAPSTHNLFVSRSLTKFYGLAGLRVGYGVGHAELIEVLHRVKPPWNVNLLAQAAAAAAFIEEEFAKRVRELVSREREFLMRELGRIPGLTPLPSSTNFILIRIDVPGLESRVLVRRLLRYGVLVRDCSSFPGLGGEYVRVAVRVREENLRLLKALRETLSGIVVG